jgi:hypothetical protein
VLRLVLAVVLAASLVAAATPAVEDARTTRSERLAERELDRVATAANALVREEDPSARRTLRVSFPGESPTEAPLAFVALGGLPDDASDDGFPREDDESPAVDTAERDVLAYRVADGRRRVLRVDVELRVRRGDGSVSSDSRALVLRGGETHRLTLQLVRLDGRPTVVVTSRDI